MSGIETVAPAFLAAGAVAWRLWGDRTDGGRRRVRRSYRMTFMPFWVRLVHVALPLLAVALLVMQAAMVAALLDPARPGWAGAIGLAGVGIGFAAFALAYRLRPPLAPRWMLDELEAGTLPPPGRDAIDRVQWGFNVAFAAFSLVSAVGLAVLDHLG